MSKTGQIDRKFKESDLPNPLNHHDNVPRMGREIGLNRCFSPRKTLRLAPLVRQTLISHPNMLAFNFFHHHLAVLNNLLYSHEPTKLARPMTHYRNIITLEPGKRGGKPCIRGMRITVYDVLDYLASGMTPEEILKDFPYLTAEDIQACLSYAADRERHLLVSNA